MRREPRYVLGVADQVPPGVARVVELVERYGRYWRSAADWRGWTRM